MKNDMKKTFAKPLIDVVVLEDDEILTKSFGGNTPAGDEEEEW